MEKKVYNLAFDFGASSGRLMLSTYDGYKITLEEVHRFPNEPVWMNGRFYWDFLRLFHEMKTGLKKIAKRDITISGIGIDTWGVDYGLLDKEGQLIANPICYRDPRTSEIIEEVEDRIAFKTFYERMGLQFMEFNTVYQLYYDTTRRSDIMKNAHTLLFMPDLFSYFLCGEKYAEYTIASTSQMMHAKNRQWDREILSKLNLPDHILQEIVQPGTIVGRLKEDVCQEVGLSSIPVIAVGGHDTASAVCATPLTSKESAYLSCGTWSLLGIENEHPIINETSYGLNFTNEGGVEGKIRFLKNITGLWILQQLKKKWSEEQPTLSYPEIIEAARNARRKDFSIDPNHERFMSPLNMVHEVQEYCREKTGEAPSDMGEIAMTAYNGITNKYKEEIKGIEKITGKTIDVLHMVGGGIQDKFLCELTAKKTGKKVVAGPIEASVIGNILMQLKALSHVNNLEEGRQIVKNSFDLETY